MMFVSEVSRVWIALLFTCIRSFGVPVDIGYHLNVELRTDDWNGPTYVSGALKNSVTLFIVSAKSTIFMSKYLAFACFINAIKWFHVKCRDAEHMPRAHPR